MGTWFEHSWSSKAPIAAQTAPQPGMASEAGFTWVSVDPNDSVSQVGVGEEQKKVDEVDEVNEDEGAIENEALETPEGVQYATTDVDTQISQNVDLHLGGSCLTVSMQKSVGDQSCQPRLPPTPFPSSSEGSVYSASQSVKNAASLMAAEITGDLENAVKEVWVPVISNGAVSTEQGVIANLDAGNLTLRPVYLCDKLVGLMFGFAMENAGFGAADLVAWLLKEDAFAKQVKPNSLCSRLSDLVSDRKLEVVWASLRLLRNLSYRQEYGQAVLESIADASWTDPTSQIYLCEICTNLAEYAKLEPGRTLSTVFQYVYGKVINQIFNLLPKEKSGHVIGYILTALLAFMCPNLLALFGSERCSGYQEYIWDAILGMDSQHIQDSGLKLILELVKSKQDQVLKLSVARMDNLFGLMGLGESNGQKTALLVAHAVQIWNPQAFLDSISSDKIKKVTQLQIILSKGTDIHKGICLRILTGLLNCEADHALYTSHDPNIVHTLLDLLESTSTDIVKGGLEALGLLVERDTAGEVAHQLAKQAVLARLARFLTEVPDISNTKELYKIFESVAQNDGRAILREAGIIQCLCKVVGCTSEGTTALALPCLQAVLGEDQENIEIAVKSGLTGHVTTILMEEIRPDALNLLLALLQSKNIASTAESRLPGLVQVLLDSIENKSVDVSLVLHCVAAIISSTSEMEHPELWISSKNIALFQDFLKNGNEAVKIQTLLIVAASVQPLISTKEPLFALLHSVCHALPGFAGRHDVQSRILNIIADFGSVQKELIAKCLLESPSVVDHVYKALIDTGMPTCGAQPMMMILYHVRELEQQNCEEMARDMVQDTEFEHGKDVEHLQSQIQDLRARLEHSLVEPEPHSESVRELERLGCELRNLGQELLETEEAYRESESKYSTEVKKVKVLTELVDQQHDQLVVLNAALE